ncbi:MAG TPA: hypothetical protein VGO50_08520 [Pyrinomonadaceae bacterium]|nr:hypothetical protein [Pyrinomonadaceae bacterium]
MKCKDFRIEVEEGLKGESLSIVAQDHAAGCRPCREFNLKHIEFREWLTVCRKVTAPKDFQFGVQRKIASTGASHTHGWAWNGLKYIVPTAALVVIAVLAWNFVATQNGQRMITPTTAAINAEVPPIKDAAKDAVPVQPAPQQDAAQQPSDQQLASGVNKAVTNSSRVTVPKENVGPGGSLVQSAANVPSSRVPQGLHVPGSDPASLSAMLISLSEAGIVANRDMKVISLKANAPAGVKVGDVVENFDGNVVTINRNGQTIKITLK